MITSRMLPRFQRGLIALSAAILFVGDARPALGQTYRPGDIIQDFTLVNRATGAPLRLSDYAGKVIFLEWFAWW